MFGQQFKRVSAAAAAGLDRFDGLPGAYLWAGLAFYAALLWYPDGWLNTSAREIGAVLIAPAVELRAGVPPDPAALPGLPLLSAARLWSLALPLPPAQALWLPLSALICLLGYSLGAALAGRAAGAAAAAALFSGQLYPVSFFDLDQRFYCLLLLIVANSMALRAPQPWKAAAEACAVGLNFLARSVLCWLPPLLAVLELRGGDPLRRRLARAALLLVLPFLFLLPWVRYDRAVAGRGAIFDNRADWNMVTGALGIVGTVEADYRKLAGMEPGESAPLWAARRIAARPLTYVSGVARRAWYIFSLYPLTLCAWAVALLLLRHRPDFMRASLVPGYFLAVHTAFSVEPRYLAPVMPLLASLSAAGLFALARPAAPEAVRREAAACFSAGAALPALLALFCAFLLLRHPGGHAGSRPEKLRAAAAAEPGEPWLLREYARHQLEAGDYAGAYAGLAGPAVAYPENMSIKVDLAAAALLNNRREGRLAPGADLIARLRLDQPGAADHAAGKQYVLRALYELEAGRPAAAAESARLARLERRRIVGYIRRDDGSDEELLHSYDAFITGRFLPELLRYYPVAPRRELCTAYVRLHEKGGVSGEAAAAWCDSMLRARAAPGAPLAFKPADFAQRPAAAAGAYLRGAAALAGVNRALAEAGRDKKLVLLEVGGEWCSWCDKLKQTFARSPALAAYRERNFVTVRIYSAQTGAPPDAVAGYPAYRSLPHLYLVASDGTLLASQPAEKFASSGAYSPDGLLAFLRAWAPGGGK